MPNKTSLNPNDFSSEEQGRVLLYSGWEIFAYRGIGNQEPLIEKVKQRFNVNGWNFSECNHRFFVNYSSIDSDIEVIFEKTEYSNEHTKNKENYKVTFKSTIIGFRPPCENNHQKLCDMVLARIPWKKRAFWLREGNRFPRPIKKMLRLKR